MKIKFKYYPLYLVLTSLLILGSCKKDFLDVVNPTVLAEASYPQKVGDLEYILVDIYGRLQDGYYSDLMRVNILIDHSDDHGYNGAEFNEFALNILNPNLSIVKSLWEQPYFAIGKCNSFMNNLNTFRKKSTLTAAELKRIDQMEGEMRFLRAYNYFYLVNLFGESPILTEADKQKMGIPLWDYNPLSIDETTKARATQGEIYDFIIADLKAAETLLKGVKFTDPRVDEWAVKGLLAKAYVFSLKWPEAKIVLKDLIDNSGKQLVSYNEFRWMFHGRPGTEFNKESIFEVNYTPDPVDNTNAALNTGTRYFTYIGPTWLDAAGKDNRNGFCNLPIHDQTMPRYGFDDPATTKEQYQVPAFIAKSKLVRSNKSVDPRLYVSTLQPYVDSIPLSGVWRKIGKGWFESYSNVNYKAWNNNKYNNIDYNQSLKRMEEINLIVLRLADIYLLYAETLIKTGDPTLGLEYINKVHRRAYDMPVNVPSVYDYVTLSDRTKTIDPTDGLATDPLKYERWAELFAEGHWWLDVRRWNLGAKEAAYYKKVLGGPLQWLDYKYAYPIPTSEINANSKIVQNPGY
jgi:hypothetical protein